MTNHHSQHATTAHHHSKRAITDHQQSQRVLSARHHSQDGITTHTVMLSCNHCSEPRAACSYATGHIPLRLKNTVVGFAISKEHERRRVVPCAFAAQPLLASIIAC